ncbi:MAG: pyrroline-5-carboxylate reductase, partial [Alphaproteobacteria bacterium RIFCSPHIGHO2_12_FULL_63_12]
GSMGGALLRGWTRQGVIDAAASAIFDPAPPAAIMDVATAHGIAVNPQPPATRFDALVIAVKPQIAATALPRFAGLAAGASTVSVMAGKSLAAISAALPGATKIMRAMPNLPAAVGAGATAIYAPQGIAAADRALAETLMRAVGEVIFVESEEAIDAVTAVSGSGPAYFFLLAEALAEAGKAVGLDDDAARKLARATLIGAGAYAAADSRSLTEMRRAVTSPGGTTDAALKILDGDDGALRQLLAKAVSAAKRRAGELTD